MSLLYILANFCNSKISNLCSPTSTRDTYDCVRFNLLYLADALSTAEFAAKKNKIMSEKVTLTEKITDIEQRSVSWLEPAREFVLSLNQAANLLSQNDLSGMTAFLKNIGSNHVVSNRQFVFEPKMQYRMTAERSEAANPRLRFPSVRCVLD